MDQIRYRGVNSYVKGKKGFMPFNSNSPDWKDKSEADFKKAYNAYFRAKEKHEEVKQVPQVQSQSRSTSKTM